MIFLSHTHDDKPVVEPIAIRLGEIFGIDKVFYDSWSIQPGDGIIDKMNEGLTNPDFVFFFVSAKSLQSNMVKLEWQNALYKATHGKCKIIPVRLDGSEMPPLLLQNIYLDLFSNHIEVTIQQMVNVIQGNNSFTPQHEGFSNLSYTINGTPFTFLEIVIRASHLMEPNPTFLILNDNNEGEFAIELNGGDPFRGGFNPGLVMENGETVNGQAIAPLGGALTPNLPIRLKITPNPGKSVLFRGVMHQVTSENWRALPIKN